MINALAEVRGYGPSLCHTLHADATLVAYGMTGPFRRIVFPGQLSPGECPPKVSLDRYS